MTIPWWGPPAGSYLYFLTLILAELLAVDSAQRAKRYADDLWNGPVYAIYAAGWFFCVPVATAIWVHVTTLISIPQTASAFRVLLLLIAGGFAVSTTLTLWARRGLDWPWSGRFWQYCAGTSRWITCGGCVCITVWLTVSAIRQ